MGLFSGAKVRRGVEAASAAFDQGDYQRAISLGEQAAELAVRHRRHADQGWADLVVYRAHFALGDLDAAERALDAVRAATGRDRSAGRPLLQWHVEHNQALLHDLAMRVPDAMLAFERAVVIAERASRTPAIMASGEASAVARYRRQSLLGIADLLGRTGKVADAIRVNEDVVNSAWRDRDGPVALAALTDRAWLHRIVGEDTEAARCVATAMDSFGELDFSTTHRVAAATAMIRVAVEAARLQAAAGNAEGLDEGFAEGREMAEQAGSPELLAEVLAAEAEIALSFGRTERALEVTDTLRSIESTNELMAARSLQNHAQALVANGRLAEAHEGLVEVVPLCHELAQPVSAFHMSLLAAWVAGELGKADDAVALVRDAVRGYGTISAAVGASTVRGRFLAGNADQRARCLTITTSAARAGVSRSGLVALEVAETWREDTCAATLRANHTSLPDDLHELVTRIDALRAAIAHPQPATTLPDQPDMHAHGRAQLEPRLDDLRGRLARAVNEGFARQYVPGPVDGDRIVEACGDRPMVSLTATDGEDGGSVCGHTVWSVPGEPVSVRRFELSPAASDLVRQLHTGRTGRDPGERTAFAQTWLDVRDELTDLLLPARLRDWLATHETELLACADGVVRNVPVAALLVSEHEVVADRAVVNRFPLLRLVTEHAERPHRHGPVRVVGAFDPTLSGSLREQKTLWELHDSEQVWLAEVTDPEELVATLVGQEYDLLVLSTRGSGAGLDYRFHLPDGDLTLPSLLGARLPRDVVAPACYSDADADATGALALLLSSGASNVVTGSWTLPDHWTGSLLSHVYRALDGVTPLPDLLNQAQRAAHPRLGAVNPLSWAGLVSTSLVVP
ncbi:tetratricopeptide repeat protein [Actinophytocola sp.]|uniref:tetratricopeptide repeat protein n=1 Tax=Actinophytocola sp. TaxID=1872138 RepID=UPI002ED090B4